MIFYFNDLNKMYYDFILNNFLSKFIVHYSEPNGVQYLQFFSFTSYNRDLVDTLLPRPRLNHFVYKDSAVRLILV